MNNASVVLRLAQESDHSFIYATWLKGIYWGDPYFQQIPQSIYWKTQSKCIQKILEDPDYKVIMAVLDNAPNEIKGYAVVRGEHVLWVYVKKDYRGEGIARLLLPGPISTYSGSTVSGHAIAKKKKLIFNPL